MKFVSALRVQLPLLFIIKACWANLAPSFTLDMHNIALSEKTPVGEVVFKLEGTDPENSPVHFGLHGTDLLKVDRDSGEVTVVRPLDREVNDTLYFNVTIEDEVNEGPFGRNNVVEVPVNVIVLDENDNEPVFHNSPYNIYIGEDTKLGATVFNSIHVTDADSIGSQLEVECIPKPEYKDACDIFKVEALNAEQNNFEGVLTLNKMLNYAEQDTYQFTLKATDGELNATAEVNVFVVDVQDTPPKFSEPLHIEIPENVDINTLVLTLHAEDGDKQKPRKITYELIDNPNDYFLLNSNSGELRTAKPLDRESILNANDTLILTVKAIELDDNNVKVNDENSSTTVKVTIKVLDINDEPPKFDQREYYVEIPENIAEGTVLPNLLISVTDPDLKHNSQYELLMNDISGAFTIEPKISSGTTSVKIIVSNTSSLDFENPNQRKFIILLHAKELSTPEALSSSATLTVTVTDVNDNKPNFEQEAFTASISETASPGTVVTSIVAKDRDSGKFGTNGIVYQLMGNGADKFVVNNHTGTITIAECEHPGHEDCLDYETKSEYLLSLKATDDDGKGQTAMVSVKINLIDSNDNPPEFSQPLFNVFVDEGAVKFDPELFVTAIDKDKTSVVKYSIISGNQEELFDINPDTGKFKIISNKGLEISNGSDGKDYIALTVEANDGKYTSVALVNITIRDINNNAPIFEKENYIASVSEDTAIGVSVATLHATDADTGLNAEIVYSFHRGSYDEFKIDNKTGIVTVAANLDFEHRNTYHIEVHANDQGSPIMTGTTTLTINIINTNNKLPYFAPATQRAEVMEDAPVGSVVHTLIALDPDVTSLDALNFEMKEPITALDKHGKQVEETDLFKQFFVINKYNGSVTIAQPLLRDIAAVVRITVVVTDVTAPNLQQNEGMLIITITDVNDSPPVFLPPWTKENPIYYVEIREEQPIGTIIGTFTAKDEDSDIAEYKIVPENQYFEVNNGTGIVQIKKQVDYEEVQKINFTIVAYDTGIPQLNATATIFVTVININDNDPKFSSSHYNVSINENLPVGAPVITVNATDSDLGEFGMITYSLIGENSEYFTIHPQTGQITVKMSDFLDHEQITETTIQVIASDGAHGNLKRSVSVPVTVHILDVNDNAPMFNQTVYNATVQENIRLNPPLPILQVFATDKDSDMNIRYKIISGNEKDIFILGIESGILYPHKSLVGYSQLFHLIIEARDGEGDGSLSDRAEIYVQVMNVNEQKPKFIMPALDNSTIELTENVATENYLVMTVKAMDKDEGENGRITYHFKVNDENVQETDEFSIDAHSGELRSKKYLDREETAKYELLLVARDHGSPKWYETVRHLTVLLVDMNDNRPEFPDSTSTNPYHFYVTENNERDLRIGQVKALDKDEGKHAKVFYYILAGNEDGSFYIDKLDGSLYTNKSFDREEKEAYNLFILANNEPDFYLSDVDRSKMTDEEISHDSSIAKVLVTVLDVNDNIPVFQKPTYYAAINAMANVNDFIVNVSAVDLDNGENGSFSYYVKASNLYKYGSNKNSGSIIPSPFTVTQLGEVRTATYVAENNQHRFVVEVAARENSPPEREGIATVYIWVFEQSQLIRIIFSRPADEVVREKEEIIAELSNATQSIIIVDEIRYHTDDLGRKNEDWCDMYILSIDPLTKSILPVPNVLKVIDTNYDFLKDYYAGNAIENVVPAFIVEKEEPFDPALAALIALLIVLFVGIITFIIVCCCVRNWVIPPQNLKKKDALIKKAIIDDLNTTENPLWIEQKLKIYEEQELTMQVFNEPEQGQIGRRNSEDFIPDDNTYATIQHPNRRGSVHMATLSVADDMPDYATLSGVPHHSISNQNSLRGVPNYYEAALGFQGSTFQVPEPANNGNDYDTFRFKNNGLTINNEGQPEYVAELI